MGPVDNSAVNHSETSSNNNNNIESSTNFRLCQECELQSSIYQCPACQLRTCSLSCCQAHKKRTQCSGKRQRSEFLPLCRMSDQSLRSDYFFLEEVLNQVMPRARKVAKLAESQNDINDNNKRTLHNQRRVSHSKKTPNPKKSRRLVQKAQQRNITLQLLPPFMERHTKNTSWYCGPRDMITWKVEWVLFGLPNIQNTTTSILTTTAIEFNISENDTNLVDQIRNKIVSMMSSPDSTSTTTEATTTKTTTTIIEWCLFLKRLPSPANQPRYIEILPQQSLRTVLEGMTIVEHPTIYCVPKNDTQLLNNFPTTQEKLIVEEQENEEKSEEEQSQTGTNDDCHTTTNQCDATLTNTTVATTTVS
ncbi:hypothetical protein IV203_034232 [Nitzschia inconspicua]|uniref:HIT-type domain-containing protein n=1 Tax=Nitzschia inconspicua TaxID=303405 RepID=A0A9K3M3A6_9STRA|nr:hypothetical protein IV203_034232 [Nitzschia inconspicua]